MNYIGITVGPILNTLSYSSTPAGLWFASYFFSNLVKELCSKLNEKNYIILTLPENHDFNKDDHGIGTYHDRIYFKSDKNADEIHQEWDAILSTVLGEISKDMEAALQEAPKSSELFNASKIEQFLKDYLQIHFAVLSEEQVSAKGIARSLADVLDVLELANKVHAEQKDNPLLKLIRGDKDSSNQYLKNYKKLADTASDTKFPLAEKHGDSTIEIRSIGDICNGNGIGDFKIKGKMRKYFAVVQCDGDSMGKTIASDDELGNLGQQEKRIQDFSKMCMNYTQEASELVRAYGGVVIYAGGDDLLFLAPVLSTKNNEAANVWELCKKIGEMFNGIVKDANPTKKPSLSFGVAIHYHKYPLYEAFNHAIGMLFGVAKDFNAERKNNLAMQLYKHSGQTTEFVCCMETNDDISKECRLYDEFTGFLRMVCGKGDELPTDKEEHEKNMFMHSVLYQLENQKSLFQQALLRDDNQMLKNLFNNTFDHPDQIFGQKMINEVISIVEKAKKACQNEEKLARGCEKAIASSNNKNQACKDAEQTMAVVNAMLRTSKFLVEEE